MASEARIQASLQIRKGNLSYQSQPSAFTADVAVANGPTPGVITATIAGTDVDLSQLASPGLCRIMNLDETNFIDVGIWDSATLVFYPLMRFLPGESFPLRLSGHLQQDNPGTGTFFTGTTSLRIKADTASCNVLVEAFDS